MMEREDKWWVKLSGDVDELEELAWLCSQPSCVLCSITKTDTIATKVSSYKSEEAYYMKSFRFAALRDSAEVFEAAQKLLQIITVIAKLHSGYKFQSIRIGNTIVRIRCGREVEVILRMSTPQASARAIRPTVTTSGQETLIPRWYRYEGYRNQFSSWIDDADKSEIFSYFVKEPDWDNLWKTYEMIKFNVDGNLNDDVSEGKCKLTKYRWVGADELINFKKAANHPSAEGGGRHSSAYHLNKTRRKENKKNKPRSWWELKTQHRTILSLMSLGEASVLIERLVKRWYEQNELEFKLAYAHRLAEHLLESVN